LIPLTVPEVRRLVIAMGEAAERRSFRRGWSRWRRAHQAIAARCRAACRARGQEAGHSSRAAPSSMPAPMERRLTDAEWSRVEPLMPSQQQAIGRPYHDHRTVLGGILWVVRSGSSWRAMPEEYGKWETADKRHRLWRATGLWQRLLSTLEAEAS